MRVTGSLKELKPWFSIWQKWTDTLGLEGSGRCELLLLACLVVQVVEVVVMTINPIIL